MKQVNQKSLRLLTNPQSCPQKRMLGLKTQYRSLLPHGSKVTFSWVGIATYVGRSLQETRPDQSLRKHPTAHIGQTTYSQFIISILARISFVQPGVSMKTLQNIAQINAHPAHGIVYIGGCFACVLFREMRRRDHRDPRWLHTIGWAGENYGNSLHSLWAYPHQQQQAVSCRSPVCVCAVLTYVAVTEI